ncbi:DUF1127 domain-containing protein [Bradyrhizobium sp. UFLA05-112]
MEMQSRQSLCEIHGIRTQPRRPSRWGTIARYAITRLRALLKGVRAAIEAELAAHHDIGEIARMSDYMLRDIGITRSEIEDRVRRPWTSMDDEPVRPSDAGQNTQALPAVNSPGLVSEGRPVLQVGVPTHPAASGHSMPTSGSVGRKSMRSS